MADEPPGKSVPEAAGDRIRETAKWLTVSLAALGAVLITGSQLSDIGALELFSPRFWAAVVGAAIAATGTVAILALAVWIATTPSMSLSSVLHKKPKATREIWNDARALAGQASVDDLATAHLEALNARDRAKRDYDAAPSEALQARLKQLDADFAYYDKVVANFLKVASYRVLAWRWQRASAALIIGGLLVGVGIGVYAWAANPPEDATESIVTPAVLTKPTAGTVSLTTDGEDALRDPLGDGCASGSPLDVLVLGTTSAGSDVLVQSSGCASIRFVLVPSWGALTPS